MNDDVRPDRIRPDRKRTGALALAAALAFSGGAAAQSQPAPTKQSPAKPAPAKPAPAKPAQAKPAAPATPNTGAPASGLPWAHPALPSTMMPAAPPAAAAPPAIAPDQAHAPLSPAQLRPAERNLIDCKQAPANAVVQVPEALSRWATIYCTRQGHILTTNPTFYSAIPGTRGTLRGVIGAAAVSGRQGDVGHGAYFTKIDYAPLTKAAAQPLMAGVSQQVLNLVKDKPLFRLDLTADNGQVYRGVVVDPGSDPFWVIPVVNGKIGQTGFYVATVDYVNRTRLQ